MASGVLLHEDRFELPHGGGSGGDEAEAAVPASPYLAYLELNMVPALFERNAFDALRQGGVVLPFDRVVEKVAVDVYGQFCRPPRIPDRDGACWVPAAG